MGLQERLKIILHQRAEIRYDHMFNSRVVVTCQKFQYMVTYYMIIENTRNHVQMHLLSKTIEL